MKNKTEFKVLGLYLIGYTIIFPILITIITLNKIPLSVISLISGIITCKIILSWNKEILVCSKKWKEVAKYFVGTLAILLPVNFTINYIYRFFNCLYCNQQVLEMHIENQPLIMFLNIVVISPILEEYVFRYALLNIFNCKLGTIIVTSIFSTLHILIDIKHVNIILFLNFSMYFILGYAFLKIYKKYGLFYTIIFHSLWNLIAYMIYLI
jgi:CAAX amino terminal protease family.